jgi:hypothetical protein
LICLFWLVFLVPLLQLLASLLVLYQLKFHRQEFGQSSAHKRDPTDRITLIIFAPSIAFGFSLGSLVSVLFAPLSINFYLPFLSTSFGCCLDCGSFVVTHTPVTFSFTVDNSFLFFSSLVCMEVEALKPRILETVTILVIFSCNHYASKFRETAACHSDFSSIFVYAWPLDCILTALHEVGRWLICCLVQWRDHLQRRLLFNANHRAPSWVNNSDQNLVQYL